MRSHCHISGYNWFINHPVNHLTVHPKFARWSRSVVPRARTHFFLDQFPPANCHVLRLNEVLVQMARLMNVHLAKWSPLEWNSLASLLESDEGKPTVNRQWIMANIKDDFPVNTSISRGFPFATCLCWRVAVLTVIYRDTPKYGK